MLPPQAYLQISSISALLTYQLRIPRVIRNEHKRVILDERQGGVWVNRVNGRRTYFFLGQEPLYSVFPASSGKEVKEAIW